MKKLKNIFYIICFSLFILTLTLSCGDQQSSTNEDIDYMEDEEFNKLMEEEVISERDVRDEMSTGRKKRRERKRRRDRNQSNVASSDPMSVGPSGCAKGDSDYLACKYYASRQMTDMAINKEKGNINTHEIYNCLPIEDKKEFLNEKIQVILVEYSYVGATPKDALLCEIQAENQILGYAHHTKGFCRHNQTARIDSLNEALEEYQNLGYQCTKEESDSHPVAASATTKKEIIPADTTNKAEEVIVPPTNAQPEKLEVPKPPWVKE